MNVNHLVGYIVLHLFIQKVAAALTTVIVIIKAIIDNTIPTAITRSTIVVVSVIIKKLAIPVSQYYHSLLVIVFLVLVKSTIAIITKEIVITKMPTKSIEGFAIIAASSIRYLTANLYFVNQRPPVVR